MEVFFPPFIRDRLKLHHLYIGDRAAVTLAFCILKCLALFCSQLFQPAEGMRIGNVLELGIYGSASLHRCCNYTGKSEKITE